MHSDTTIFPYEVEESSRAPELQREGGSEGGSVGGGMGGEGEGAGASTRVYT